MFTSDFLKDAKSRIQMVLSRDHLRLIDILFVGFLAVLAALFVLMLLLLDLFVLILRTFGL